MRDDSAVIVFVKAPVRGTVKTRLAGTIGDADALALYLCFVADVLAMLKSTGRTIKIYFHPANARDQVRAWLGEGLDLFPQNGASLGDKMRTALTETFAAGVSRAVIIGSDLPDLPPDIIHEAFDQLLNHPAVIGPGTDGGYYLIGFTANNFLPDVFDEIHWGTDTVLADTLKRFDEHGMTPRRLAVWRDIDTAEDLESFARQRRDAAGIAVHTRQCLGRGLGNQRSV
jgi:rSAM/selenodomain-associated transferase 1